MKACKSIAQKLKKEIRRVFQIHGLKVQVRFELVPKTKFWRIYVVAPVFKRMMFFERQDYVWRIAQDVLSRDERFCISMIVTLSPREAKS